MTAQNLHGIYLAEQSPEPFIMFIDGDFMNREYPKWPGLLISFNNDALPQRPWPPLLSISGKNCLPILLDEQQSKEFQELFHMIETELHTSYIFKEEYIRHLIRLIILLMDKITINGASNL
jgi:hypothetical protein